MNCGTACEAAVPIGETLRSLPAGEWATVTVDLRCFVRAGAKLAELHTPFRLYTQGQTTLGLSDARFEGGGAGNATITCAS
jgi:beta-glucosidase